ncbi:MAG: tRNA pseudouridine(38-40) synthase TruA [Pyrinomonadaceae bacterium]|nr:tRNA pseudouridine(38-40) synthase TruA [Pyrinomonadaceae bacterium]MDQ3134692.1 tRNA pseudouridine(38-40) synthase TruA [Acidobacteriota bacterium]
MNYKLTLQYDGTEFHGWQLQGTLRTVQGELTRALLLLDGQAVVVHGAGRTDAGVHAEGQVAHVHLRHEMTPEKLRAAINGNVGRDLRALRVEIVPDDFHARFAARGKTYCYRVCNAPFHSPFLLRYSHHDARKLDIELLREGARLFVGTHDWTAFSCARADVASRVRTLSRLDVREEWNEAGQCRLIELTLNADGFLRYMARSIVGTLLDVGRGALDLAAIARALKTGGRSLAGATAPARGLTLKRVHYGDE